MNSDLTALTALLRPARRSTHTATVFAAACVCLALAAPAPAHAVTVAVAVVNGSLTGQPTNGGVPTGWTSLRDSPDTNDVGNNSGLPYYAFPVTPSASPDGGSWVGIGADLGTNFAERFGQTISGFTVGAVYRVAWYAANFGFGTSPFGYIAPAQVNVLIDGASVGYGSLLPLQPGWIAESLTFTAAASTLQLAFGSSVGPRSYISIDGIGLAPAAAVPEPTAALLMLAGLGAVAGLATRRQLAAASV